MHSHQHFRLLLDVTSSGVKSAFSTGCHSATVLGETAARLLVAHTRRPEQNGHPEPPNVLLSAPVAHSWPGCAAHFHQNLLLLPAKTS